MGDYVKDDVNSPWSKRRLYQVLSSKRLRTTLLSLLIILVLSLSLVYLWNDALLLGFSAPNSQIDRGVNWSRFAYTQYATTPDYLCNSVMLFESLRRLNSNASRLLMYPSHIHIAQGQGVESFESRLLRKARDEYNVILKAVQVQRMVGAEREFTRRPIQS